MSAWMARTDRFPTFPVVHCTTRNAIGQSSCRQPVVVMSACVDSHTPLPSKYTLMCTYWRMKEFGPCRVTRRLNSVPGIMSALATMGVTATAAATLSPRARQATKLHVQAGDAFHPDLRRIARWLPRAGVSPRTLRFVRMGTHALGAIPAKGVAVRPVGLVSVRVHQPASSKSEHPRPALLWIHGGGYVIGSAAQDDAVCRHFAQQLGIVVAAVEYRLAPEHPFPAALDDCYEALTWLTRQRGVGHDPRRRRRGECRWGAGGRTGIVGSRPR